MEQVSGRPLQGKRVAMLMTDGVEQIEYTSPRSYLEERGATVVLLSPKNAGEYRREYEGGGNQTDTQRHVDPVSEALAHGGAQDLDDPEPHRHLGHLAQHYAARTDGLSSRCLGHSTPP